MAKKIMPVGENQGKDKQLLRSLKHQWNKTMVIKQGHGCQERIKRKTEKPNGKQYSHPSKL